ncbi:choice-of-anchor H family protein [Shewanella eurypsychrophilus]|uniref:Choice-of-anchor H family protein n=2 Tax=Shewanellaceae TaxID=267890 RepID=A0ABX6VCV2_9GAMM|nr:GlyGly-CTERM sorting domain-containing protein [Shewanella sp. YLB-09]QPG60530.1 choice-of-anchor H family protein [Shewanella eurypsychrophilus]
MNVNMNNNQACEKSHLGLRFESSTRENATGIRGLKRIFLLSMIVAAPISMTPNAYASDDDTIGKIEKLNSQTYSVGNQAKSVEEDELNARVNQLKQLTPLILPNLNPKTREQVIAEHQSGNISPKYAVNKSQSKSTIDDAQSTVPKAFSNPIYHEFSIYEATSRLFVDEDGDGFYQTFSVTFDADVYGPDAVEVADVYAELYLSRDGGPWVHYYSTDIFTIIGDSTDDDFEVLTTLHNGYYTDHYDVLVDLYEVGFDDIVATISSDDTDNLYALPLESSDRDTVYTGGDSSSEGHGGGALSFLSMLILAGLGIKRRWI